MTRFSASLLRLTAHVLCRTPSFRTTSSPFLLTKRVPSFPICATDGKKAPDFSQKVPLFCAKVHNFLQQQGKMRWPRDTKKDCTPIHCTVLLYFNPNSRRAAYFFGRSSLRSSGSRIVSRVDGFLCSTFCCSFGLLFHGLCTGCRRVLHLATASLGGSFAGCFLAFSSSLLALFFAGCFLAFCTGLLALSFAGCFLAFCTGLLALGGLFCSAFGSLLPLGAGFLCALFAARFHFFLGRIGIHLHHLRGSSGTYGEHGGESQTAEEGVEIKFHCFVVLVVYTIRVSVSFVKTHGVIFYRRHFFPVYACKCNAKARRKQIKTSEYGNK